MSRQQGWDDDRHYAMGCGVIIGLFVFAAKAWIAFVALFVVLGLFGLEPGKNFPVPVVVLAAILAAPLFSRRRKNRY